MLKFNQAKKVMESVKFVFVANGKKYEFDTPKEMREAYRELQSQGIEMEGHFTIECEEVKASASLEFDSYTSEEHGRTLTAYVTVKSKQAEEVFIKLASIVERGLGEYFMGCPDEGEGYYTDGITLDYVHGSMTSTKEDIKYVFKMAKKELGIR